MYETGAGAKATPWVNSAGWAYNWNADPDALPANMQYIPTLWCDASDLTSKWDARVAAAAARQNPSDTLFSFNEPDLGAKAQQCNATDITAAVKAHTQWISKPYSKRFSIGSPSVSNSIQPGEGVFWLDKFLALCKTTPDCHVDFLVIHWYNAYSADVNELFKQVNAALAVGQKYGIDKLYLNEYALQWAAPSVTTAFMQASIAWLEKSPNILGYGWFMLADKSLMNGTAVSDPIGTTYRDYVG